MLQSAETGQRTVAPASFQRLSLTLDFFPDVSVEIVVSSESRPSFDVLSITGHAAGSELAIFSMTVTTKSYLMTFDNPETARIYRVVGETSTGIGEVIEIDRRAMPPIIHSSPIIPPNL